MDNKDSAMIDKFSQLMHTDPGNLGRVVVYGGSATVVAAAQGMNSIVQSIDVGSPLVNWALFIASIAFLIYALLDTVRWVFRRVDKRRDRNDNT